MDSIIDSPKTYKNMDTKQFDSSVNNKSGIVKRVFDIVAALIGLLLLAPLFLVLAVLIKRDSPGPVFFWGQRIGRHGRLFRILKFRTMYETEASYKGPRVTGMDDDRVTPLGAWLRDTKLNELPQLWNVLIGDMSLVGPRPEDPGLAKTWPARIARELLSVRPGITSPASVLYRDEESMLHAGDVMRKYLHELSPDKMRLDQLYVRYRSLWLDIDVLFWTAVLLIPRIKAYSPPEQLLFVGPVSRLIQRYINWFLLDLLIVLASVAVTGTVLRLFGPLHIGWLRSAEMALGYAMVYAFIGILLRTDRVNWPKATSWEAGRLGAAWLISTALVLGLHAYMGFTSLRALGIIFVTTTLSLAGIVFMRYRGRLIDGLVSRLATLRLKFATNRERVIIVGSGRTAEHIAWLMDHPTYSGKFQVLGFIDDDLRSQGMRIYGSKVIGRIHDIARLVKEQDVGLIILADFQTAALRYRDFRQLAIFKPARVVVAPDIFGSLSGLGNTSVSDGLLTDLNDFQCQHCLARYASLNHHGVNETDVLEPVQQAVS